jgi:hypothetical protein
MSRPPSKSLELLPAPEAAAPDRTPAPYRPFPVEALPDGLDGFARAYAAAMACDAAHLALPALAVAASAIGTTRVLRLGPGREEPCVVWSAVVSEGRWRPGTAVRKAVWPLVDLQYDRLRDYRLRQDSYQNQLRVYEKGLHHVYPPREPPVEPALERLLCCDTSVDALAEILRGYPRGTLVYRDELDGWLLTLARPRGRYAPRDRAGWPELHRAGVLFVDARPGGCRFLVRRAAASLTGTLGRRALARALASDAPGAGVTARLLLAMPPPLRNPVYGANPDLGPGPDCSDLVVGLLNLRFAGDEPDREPSYLSLSSEARAAWSEFEAERQRDEPAGDERLADALAELEGYAGRFVLLHLVVRCVARRKDDLVPVGRESVEAAVTLWSWFADETRRIYATLCEPAAECPARRLAEFIQRRGGRISVRDLQKARWRDYQDAAAVEAALADLVNRGIARWVVEPGSNGALVGQDGED